MPETTGVDCRPAWRRFGQACRMPVWNSHGPGVFAVLVWTPILLLDPVLSLPRNSSLWLALAGMAGIVAAQSAAVVVAYRDLPHGPRTVVTLLGVQTGLTVITTYFYGAHWGALFTMLALTYGAVGSPKWAPRAVLGLTVVSGLVSWLQGGEWANVWVAALTTFLCGMATYGFHRLLSVIAELDATRQELAREAVDRERLRFSRDLHDLLGHTLSVVVVKAEAIRRLLPADTVAAAGHAADIEAIGRESLTEVRAAVTGYRDTDLGRELDRAKIALDAAGITLNVDRPGTTLPSETDTVLGWVVREAVTNVLRHSAAENCRIGLTTGDDSARLSVTDDGRGGEPNGGAGLRGLRERVTAADGTLTISPSRHGFGLDVEVPLR